MSRQLSTQAVKRFKGMNAFQTATSLPPEWARECLNVIPSASGGLDKLRLPVDLSAAIPGLGSGPDQFAMYESSFVKQVLAFYGTDIYKFELDGFASSLLDSDPLNLGSTAWSLIVSNNLAFGVNGARTLKWNGTAIQNWGIAKPSAAPAIAPVVAGTLTLATGRKYRVAFVDGVSGHIGTASDASASTGALINNKVPVSAAAATDTQVTAYNWYATRDGGEDYYFHSQTATPNLDDELPDDALNSALRAPLINDPPPVGKFLQLWQGRVFIFNLEDDRQAIAYSGYERILSGRPEQSFPPSNRLRLATGADEIAGGGVIPAGIVAFDKTSKMFMFKGSPSDITNTAPVPISAFLQELPWAIGCASHFTIKSTAYGLAWLSPDRRIQLFDGTNKPICISNGVEPILRRMTQGTEYNCRAEYFSYVDRDWYVLVMAVDGSYQLNHMLMIDMDEDSDRNVGAFQFHFDDGVDSIGVVELFSTEQKLVIGQKGLLKELKVLSTTTNGINEARTTTSGRIGAYWKGGYFGGETPQLMKTMRYARFITDNQGFRVKRYLIDDINSKITAPEIMDFEPLADDGVIVTNKKAKRESYEIRFPDDDVDCSVLEMTHSFIPASER